MGTQRPDQFHLLLVRGNSRVPLSNLEIMDSYIRITAAPRLVLLVIFLSVYRGGGAIISFPVHYMGGCKYGPT